MENLQKDHLRGMDLEIDNQVRQQFYDTARWTKFISIVMFVACGLLLVFGTIGGAALYSVVKKMGAASGLLGELSGALFITIILLVTVVLAIVYYFLFNFSRKVKNALLSENAEELNAGLRSLKTFFIITTVFAILSLLNSIASMFY